MAVADVCTAAVVDRYERILGTLGEGTPTECWLLAEFVRLAIERAQGAGVESAGVVDLGTFRSGLVLLAARHGLGEVAGDADLRPVP